MTKIAASLLCFALLVAGCPSDEEPAPSDPGSSASSTSDAPPQGDPAAPGPDGSTSAPPVGSDAAGGSDPPAADDPSTQQPPPGPRPELCDTIAGSNWLSVEERECGRGGARCRWRISFEADRFSRRWSDVGSGGSWTCEDGTLLMEEGDLQPTVVLTPDHLDFEGLRYQRAPREPEEAAPPATATPPASTPAPAPAPKPGVTPTADGSIPKIGGASDRACEKDSDCVVTEQVDGSCCNAGCGPSASVRQEFLPKLKAHRAEVCAARTYRCPAMGCAIEDYAPRCIDKTCRAVKGRL